MRQGRKPTRQEKIFLRNKDIDPAAWLIYKNTSTGLHLVHRVNGETRIIPKEN